MLCHLVCYGDNKASVKFAASMLRVEEQYQKLCTDHVTRTSRHVTEYRRMDLHFPPTSPHILQTSACIIIREGLEEFVVANLKPLFLRSF